MQFRPEKIVRVDKVAKKKKYSPKEVKQQADKARFRDRESE